MQLQPSDALPKIMRARYYGASLGSFVSVDPGNAVSRHPQSWNRYMYALGNPVGLVDPDGRTVRLPRELLEATAIGVVHSREFLQTFGRLHLREDVVITVTIVDRPPFRGVDANSTYDPSGGMLRGRVSIPRAMLDSTPEYLAAVLGHELEHGEEVLETGQTLEERAAAGDSTVIRRDAGENDVHLCTPRAKEAKARIRSQISASQNEAKKKKKSRKNNGPIGGTGDAQDAEREMFGRGGGD